MGLRLAALAAAALAAACAQTGAVQSQTTGDEALPDALAAGWDGESVCRRVQEDDHVRVLECAFPPGVGHERHFHPPHYGYVLEGGRMRTTSADGVNEIDTGAGASWESAGVPWHEALNIGDTTTRYLIIELKYEQGEAP